MDAIVNDFINSDLCESLGNDPRCPDVIDAVLRNGLPLLAADEYANGDFEKVSIDKKEQFNTRSAQFFSGLQCCETWHLSCKKNDNLLRSWLDQNILFLKSFSFLDFLFSCFKGQLIKSSILIIIQVTPKGYAYSNIKFAILLCMSPFPQV